MKKLTVVIVFLGAIFGMGASAPAQYFSDFDTMSVIPVEGHPGDTVTVPVDLLNTFSVGGFQLRLTFDSWYFAPVAMRLTSRSEVFDLFGSYFEEPGAASFIAASQHPLEYSRAWPRTRNHTRPRHLEFRPAGPVYDQFRKQRFNRAAKRPVKHSWRFPCHTGLRPPVRAGSAPIRDRGARSPAGNVRLVAKLSQSLQRLDHDSLFTRGAR